MDIDIEKRNHVRMIGEGTQTIMFAHGFGCEQSMWQYITPAFTSQYRIVLFDYVGSGRSDLSAYSFDKYSSLHGYVQDVLDIIDYYKLNQVIFIGHSISSMVGMLASIRAPHYFQELIMIGPSPCYLNDGEYYGGFTKSDIMELLDMMEMNFTGWASFMAPLAMNNPDQPEFAQELHQTFISTDPVIARRFAEVTFFADHRDDLSEVRVPTLIMQCSDDSIVPSQVGEYMHKKLKGSVLERMEAKGHYPHISHPAETISLIQRYLAKDSNHMMKVE